MVHIPRIYHVNTGKYREKTHLYNSVIVALHLLRQASR